MSALGGNLLGNRLTWQEIAIFLTVMHIGLYRAGIMCQPVFAARCLRKHGAASSQDRYPSPLRRSLCIFTAVVSYVKAPRKNMPRLLAQRLNLCALPPFSKLSPATGAANFARPWSFDAESF